MLAIKVLTTLISLLIVCVDTKSLKALATALITFAMLLVLEELYAPMSGQVTPFLIAIYAGLFLIGWVISKTAEEETDLDKIWATIFLSISLFFLADLFSREADQRLLLWRTPHLLGVVFGYYIMVKRPMHTEMHKDLPPASLAWTTCLDDQEVTSPNLARDEASYPLDDPFTLRIKSSSPSDVSAAEEGMTSTQPDFMIREKMEEIE